SLPPLLLSSVLEGASTTSEDGSRHAIIRKSRIKTMQDSNGNHALPKPATVAPVAAENLRIRLLADAPGVAEYPGVARMSVSLHVGAPCFIACRRGGDSHRGTAIHGDIDMIPEGTPSIWELAGYDTALVLSFAPQFLRHVAEESGLNPQHLEFRHRFPIHHPRVR